MNPSDIPDINTGYGKSECHINVKNLTNDYIAIRVKTTKKEIYSLSPTYSLIQPNSNLDIKFTYTIRDIYESPDKHKFKIEAIVIPESYKTKEVKMIYDFIVKNKTPIRGCTIKLGVIFNNRKFTQNNRNTKTRDVELDRSLNPNCVIYENILESE